MLSLLPTRGMPNYGNLVKSQCPMNRGLVSRWLNLPQRRGGATFHDLCRRNDGTLTNGPLWSGALGRPGGFGSLFFDGSNDYINIPDADILTPTGDFAFCAWAYRTSESATNTLFSKGAASNDREWQLTCRDSGSGSTILLLIGDNGGNWNVALDGAAMALTTWTHILGQLRGTTAELYVNGALSASVAYGGTNVVNTGTAVSIGRASQGAEYWPGYLDDLRFYLRSFVAGEVLFLYNDSRLVYSQTLNYVTRHVVNAVAAAGRTTKNTRAFPLGVNVGMDHRQCNI